MGFKTKEEAALKKAVKEGKLVTKKEKRETSEERKAREEREDEEWEKQCENYCARGITLMMMASPIWSLLSFVGEWAARVPMIVDEVDMSGQRVIITGGCGGMGVDLATIMVVAGASVVLACRDSERAEEAVRQVQLGLAESQLDNVLTMPLDLASFESVRGFAEKYTSTIGAREGLHVLVNNAGTANACNTTEDGHELAFQTNYLGHFLLTDLLLPTLKANVPSRIVHVTCDSADEAKVDINSLDGLGEDLSNPMRCLQEKQYGMAKLAQIVHSNELERRLRAERKKNNDRTPGVVSHVINPGGVNSEFYNKAPEMTSVSGRQSMRTKMLMYFPPFRMMAWLMGGVKDLIVNGMTRSVMRGATAQFHVASNPELAWAGGQIYSDNVGLFTNCGKSAEECGRVVRQPALATDPSMRKALWKKSKQLVREYSAPLGEAWEAPGKKYTAAQLEEINGGGTEKEEGAGDEAQQEEEEDEDDEAEQRHEEEKVVDEEQFFADEGGEEDENEL